jgi:hypothetical protein
MLRSHKNIPVNLRFHCQVLVILKSYPNLMLMMMRHCHSAAKLGFLLQLMTVTKRQMLIWPCCELNVLIMVRQHWWLNVLEGIFH